VLAAELDGRWGPFVSAEDGGEPAIRIQVGEAGGGTALPHWSPGEPYRIQAVPGEGAPGVRSYGFVLDPVAPDAFRLGLVRDSEEPAARRLENAARVLVTRLALSAGGIALHGAVVLAEHGAHVLAGPSRAGKTTAVGSLRWPSLGDDFAVVVPDGGRWQALATPFDNREAVPTTALTGAWPLLSVWRLEQGPSGALRELRGARAAAMLTACAAFPWALPDLADALVAAAVRCAGEVRCGVLTFARDTDLRGLLGGG
jgi:hypothetical protein